MEEELSRRLAVNVRQLRDAQGLTQQQAANLAGLPRATWAQVESGAANPTLAVMHRLANALRISLEELVAVPQASCRYYPRTELPEETRGAARIRRLLPDPIPGIELERLELPSRSQMTGVPHTPGTREYLACEAGEITLFAAGEAWTLKPGDVVVFRGDQRHSYRNTGPGTAIGYSVILRVPAHLP